MKDKFKEALLAAVKDCGLSDKAVNELLEQGASAIGDDATEEQVQAQVHFFAGIAKCMQGEVTRKVQEAKQPTGSADKKKDAAQDPEGGKHATPSQEHDVLLQSLRAMQEQLTQLQQAQEQSAKAQAEAARQAIVRAAAKKAGISEAFAAKLDSTKVQTAEEAEQFFADIKQEFVNSNLRPKGADGRFITNGEADKAAADAWAQTLKDR